MTSASSLAMEPAHAGVILCMNVCGSTKPSLQTAREGVLEAWDAAKAHGPPPGAILVQEYSWADKSLGPLLDNLSDACGGDEWQKVRQWSEEKSRDTVVLFNTAVYAGRQMANGQYMEQASSQTNLDSMLGKLPAGTKEQILSYRTRWAGVHLAVLNPSTGKPTRIQFLLVSYHGREKRKQSGQNAVTSIQSPVKAILAQDFVAEVARAGAQSTFLFDVPEGKFTKCIPAFIAGDWNADISAFFNFNSLAYGTVQWQCSHHAPRRPHSELSVRVDSDGVFKGHIDYAVAINYKHDHELSCDVAVTDVQALVHTKERRQNESFDHDPLLIQIQVTPRHQLDSAGKHGTNADAKRVAAAAAKEKVHLALTGRPTGQQIQDQAKIQPPPSFQVAGKLSSTESSPVKPAKEAQMAPHPAPLTPAAPPTTDANAPIILARCPARYDLSQKYEGYSTAKLKDALKAMTLDALGIPNGRGQYIRDYSEAVAQPWWPKGITNISEFDSLSEAARRKLYAQLQALLLQQGAGVATKAIEEPVPTKSSIVSAAGMLGKLRKSFSRLGSKKGATETAREP